MNIFYYKHTGKISGENTIPVRKLELLHGDHPERICLIEALTGYPFDIVQSQKRSDYDIKPDRGAPFTYWSNRLWVNISDLRDTPADNATLRERGLAVIFGLDTPGLSDEAIEELNAEMLEIMGGLAEDGGTVDDPRSVLEVAQTPPICDAHGRVRGQWREPSRDEDMAHLARHGY